MITLFGYKKCSTCRKAEKFFEKNEVAYEFVDITTQPPTKAQLKKALSMDGLTVKKLFNTSGQVYREMGLKDRMDAMSRTEALSLLADNGKLIKRPFVLDGEQVTVGFREEEFKKKWV